MSPLSDTPSPPPADPAQWRDVERALDRLLTESHATAPHELPALVSTLGAASGAHDTVLYLADLQQVVLVPFLGADRPGTTNEVHQLPIDSTLAGRAFQLLQVLTSDAADGDGVRVWVPLLDGADRVGMMAVTVTGTHAAQVPEGPLGEWLRRFATLVAELIVTKAAYGDVIRRTRRRARMGLAAEIQWGLLPPLTFASKDVVIASALEPAYEVAGDSLDYAVDLGRARLAVFDGMGHGLQSAQLAALTVSAYRNCRRSDHTLAETARFIDGVVQTGFADLTFSTGILAELDTDTGLLTWLSAGHPAPLLLRDGKLVKTLEVVPGLPFGLGLPDLAVRYPVAVEQLQPGDRVLIYTDGITEARSQDGEFFGVDRLVDLIVRHEADHVPAPETLRRLVRALMQHQHGQLSDDATMLLLEWRGGNQATLAP